MDDGKLNSRQEAFCRAYIKGNNLAKAYMEAGYEASSLDVASASGNRLLKNEKIQKRLQELNDKAESSTIASIAEMQEILSNIIRAVDDEDVVNSSTGEHYTKKASHKDRVKAIELLGKMKGAFTEKVEVSGSVGVNIVNDF